MEMPIVPELEEEEWIARTNFPIGLDVHHQLFPLNPTDEIYPLSLPLYNSIIKTTKDTALNIPTIIKPNEQ